MSLAMNLLGEHLNRLFLNGGCNINFTLEETNPMINFLFDRKFNLINELYLY